MNKEPKFIIIDLFCGAGGVTEGFVQAMYKGETVAKVVACINHDHKAILSHWSNHKDVKHFEEDIRNLDLTELKELVEYYRKKYPNAYIILWASLECTNFSKAKGGLAREEDSRTLAYTLYQKWNDIKKEYEKGDSYVQLLNPDFVMIENVVEFKDWGPSRIKMKNGKPVMIKNKHGETVPGYEDIPEFRGQEFNAWCKGLCKLGYHQEWKQMNSADYGAYTSRNRLFGMFAKEGLDIVWPEPTHSKGGKNGLIKWKAVKEKLDFCDEGYSIFYRGTNLDVPKRQRKDLVDNTLERIYAGCIKHIAGGKEAFLTKYHGTKEGGQPRTASIENPLTVIDTQNRHSVVQTSFISKYFSGRPDGKNISIDEPAGTITTKANQALVQSSFLDKQYGGKDNHQSINQPSGVIVKNDKHALVQASFIDRPFTDGGGKNSSVEDPVGSILSVPKLNLIQAEHIIDSTQYGNTPTNENEPLPVITANRKYPYLLSFQYRKAQMQGIDQPAPVILATSGKTPLHIFIAETGEASIRVYENDSEIIIKLKEFMALYNIVDIKMRMLRVDELLKIQGFPDDYNLLGTQEDQKKFIGNSVVPQIVKSWTEAMAEHIIGNQKNKVA